MENKKKILIKLFISTLYLSTFTFGGGYVIVTLMKKKFVDEYHWFPRASWLLRSLPPAFFISISSLLSLPVV